MDSDKAKDLSLKSLETNSSTGHKVGEKMETPPPPRRYKRNTSIIVMFFKVSKLYSVLDTFVFFAKWILPWRKIS